MTRDTSSTTNRLPTPGAGFIWDERDGIAFIRPDTSRVAAAFTTRLGGVSPSPWDTLNLGRTGDDEERVHENRRRVGAALRVAAEWSTVHQVHGPEVVEACDGRPDADGLWTADTTATIAVFGADCPPVLLVGDGMIAAVHAGWRGIVSGVVERGVVAAGASDAWIGPGIGPCCYAVGDDVRVRFLDRFGPGVVDRDRVDVMGAAEVAARSAGATRVHTARLCTKCHPGLFFSHRGVNGQRTGHQALVARMA